MPAVPKPTPRPRKARLPIPRVNKERAAKREERDYGPKGAWIRRQSCCCSGTRTGNLLLVEGGQFVLVRIVAAHFPSRGAGGRSQDLVPLADSIHRRAHQLGDKAVEKQFGVNFKQLAAFYERQWQKIERSRAG